MEKSTILIADDDCDILDTLAFRLEQRGYRVIKAHDGEEALKEIREFIPDLVILDVMMPKENGYRVSKMVKEDERAGKFSKKIPIILLTARNLGAQPEREQMFMDFSHANEVIYKPFEMDNLLEKIGKLLGNGSKPRQ
jgi:DNA-binding response OmpR family regulator